MSRKAQDTKLPTEYDQTGQTPSQSAFDAKPEGPVEASGLSSERFAEDLYDQVSEARYREDLFDRDRISDTMQAVQEVLQAAEPRDEIEAMLVGQMITAHNTAMDCLRRAAHPNASPQVREQNLKHAAKFMGVYERQVAALDKRRGRGKQKITVEHVHVHGGGQAIVGNVDAAAIDAGPQEVRALEDDSAASLDGEKLAEALKPSNPKARVAKRP